MLFAVKQEHNAKAQPIRYFFAMPRHFVKIVNRGTYTSPKKASDYVRRQLAEEFFVSLTGQVLEIRMLEAAELAILRSYIASAKANFDDGTPRRWATKLSGGIGVKQLLPIGEVGVGMRVTHRTDKLIRRTAGRSSRIA